MFRYKLLKKLKKIRKDMYSDEDIKIIEKSPLFDSEWYLSTYGELIDSSLSPAEHYMYEGEQKGFIPSLEFDPILYKETYADVKENGINALLHYEKYGRKEGRKIFPAKYRPIVNGIINSLHELYDHNQKIDNIKEEILYPSIRFGFDPFSHPDYKTLTGEKRKQYEIMASEFDADYYMLVYQDILRAYKADGFNPLRHYMNHGYKEGRNPNPWFNTKYYMEKYPHIRESNINPFYHYLIEGRRKGYSCHYMHPKDELFSDVSINVYNKNPNDLYERIEDIYKEYRNSLDNGELATQIRKASELDPLVGVAVTNALTPIINPFVSYTHLQKMKIYHELCKSVNYKSAKLIILVDSPRFGGGLRMEGYIAHALKDYYGANEIVVIITDEKGEVPKRRFPKDARIVNYFDIAADLSLEDKMDILVRFIRALTPESIFIINSGLMWNALRLYKTQMSDVCKIFGCFFTDDKTLFGEWMGYPSLKFYRYFDYVSTFYTDSQYLAQKLRNRYLVPRERKNKILVLPAPVDPKIPFIYKDNVNNSKNIRPRIFWAGRFDRQKRIDIVYKIAKCLPTMDFFLWGGKVIDNINLEEEKPENVTFMGYYSNFVDLPLEECDVWLYTSEWDGVPSILIEVAMTGIPVVASRVGGVEEVILPDYGWLVNDIEDIETYVKHIKWITNNKEKAMEKTKMMRDILIKERTWEKYKNILVSAIKREKRNAKK